MKIICKECKIEITNNLTKLIDEKKLTEEDGKDHIPQSKYFVSNGDYYTGSQEKIIINKNDLINSKYHSDSSRLCGCCGPSGDYGINKVCINGHEIGTLKGDCWMSHCVILEPDLIFILDD